MMSDGKIFESTKDFRVRNLERFYEQTEEARQGGRYRHYEVEIDKLQYLLSEAIGLHQHVARLEEMLRQYAEHSLIFPQPIVFPNPEVQK